MHYDEENDVEVVDFKELRRQMREQMKMQKKVQKNVKSISISELYNQLQVSPCKIRIYDTRNKEEFQKYSLPYSINLPSNKEKEISTLLPVLSDSSDEFIALVSKDVSNFTGILAKELSLTPSKSESIYILNTSVLDFCERYPFMLHQQTSFIPFPSEILPWLYIGGAYNGYTLEQIESVGFKCIINASGQSKVNYPKSIKVVDYDGTLDSLKHCCKILAISEAENIKTLVFSGLGQHRSPAICVFYLQKEHKMLFDEAFDVISKSRPLVRDGKEIMLHILQDLSK